MVRVDPVRICRGYWVPIAISMVAGSVAGALALTVISNSSFGVVIGFTFLLIGLWFIFRTGNGLESWRKPPEKANFTDLRFGILAGFCGGFVGVNAPVLVFHFGKSLNKQILRRLLVLIFIPSAIVQTATFGITGLLTSEIVKMGVATIPTIVLGIYLGNRVFMKLSESTFRRVLGIMLIFIAIRAIVISLT